SSRAATGRAPATPARSRSKRASTPSRPLSGAGRSRAAWTTSPARRSRTRPGLLSTSLSPMDELERYLSQHYWTEDDVLREVRADIAERGPQIQVSAEAGRLLALLVRLAGATRVLELGTLFGY